MSVLKKLMNTDTKVKYKGALKEVPAVVDPSRNPYTEVQILSAHLNIVKSIIKVDKNRFLSLSDDGTSIVWNIQTGRQIATIKREDGRPFSCGIIIRHKETDDYVFISASSDKSVQIWDLVSGECVRTMSEPSSSIRCLQSVRSGRVICAAGNNICMWGMGGSLLGVLHGSNPEDISGIISITGDRLVARADNRLYVYRTSSCNTGQSTTETVTMMNKLLPHREAITVLENISDGFFVSGSEDGTIILWRVYDMLPVRYFNSVKHYEGHDHNYPHSVQCILALDERYICAAIGPGFGVYDSLNGNTVIEMPNCHHSNVVCLTMVWDNSLLCTCSEDGTVRLWGLRLSLDSHPPTPNSAPSSLYQLLGIGEKDPPPWQKRAMTLELQGECAGHSGRVQMLLDYGQSGIVTCGVDSLIILWKNAEMESMWRTEKLRLTRMHQAGSLGT